MKKLILIFTYFFFYNFYLSSQQIVPCMSVPVNDSPCINYENPPFDLGVEGTHHGTTCCAVGYNDDPNADLKNQKCSAVSDDNAVWYRAEYDADYSDGLSIYIYGDSIGNDVAVEIYVGGPDAICDGTAELRKSKCDGLPIEDMHIGCLEDGDYVWIKVTSSDGDCGTFTITVDNIKDCDVADACEDITGGQTLDPVTPDDVSFDWVCANGCLDLACPDGIGGGCDFSQNPTVWFQVNTDYNARLLFTQVSTWGNWSPVWSVWHPEPDCDNLANAGNFAGSFPCSSQSTPPDLLIVPVAENETYYISITADPNGEPIDDPAFELCVGTVNKLVYAPDPSLVWEVTNRENTDAEPDGPPYMGPFCPGEELTVHLTFQYDAIETYDDWLIGFIPKFGCGWNTEDYDYNANAPFGNGQTAKWYTEDGDCPPQIMQNVGHLCTYTDEDGHLKLINTLWEKLPDGVTCSNGLNKYDTLPSGYFWVQEGGSPDCDANNCSPSRKYGIGTSLVDISWDFTMKVKEFNNRDDCLDCNDLSIVIQTFSDGNAGCWENTVTEHLIDKPQWSPQWQVNCQIPPGVVAEPQPREICTGGEVGILVYTEDGSPKTIEITYDDNPNISGESDHTFYGGSGTIDDVLTIDNDETCDPETVTYYAQVVMDSIKCEGKIDTIVLTVYPSPSFNIHTTDMSGSDLNDATASLIPSCDDSLYSYKWNTGDTTNMISNLSTGIYYITVLNDYGCTSSDSVIIPKYKCSLTYEKSDETCYDACDGFIHFSSINGNSPFTYIWNTGDTTGCIDHLCAGIYTVVAKNTLGCTVYDTIKLYSPPKIHVNYIVNEVDCYGECNGSIKITQVENAEKPLKYLWSNGDTTDFVQNLCSGIQTIKIQDASGCFYMDSINVGNPDKIVIVVDTLINISKFGPGGIFMSVKSSGAFSYEWKGPDDFTGNNLNLYGLNTAGCYTLTVKDTLIDCSIDTTICIKDLTGVSDIATNSIIKIYPIPASENVILDFSEIKYSEAVIEIFKFSGSKIYTIKNKSNKRFLNISLQSIPTGIYYLKIKLDKSIIYKKLIVVK